MTKPAAPPPIALTDLDRDELLRLLSGRLMAFTARDLWGVRWDTLSARACAARARAGDALDAYVAPPARPNGRPTGRALIRELEADEARKAAWKRAKAAAERAEAAEERAWRALEACEPGRIVA